MRRSLGATLFAAGALVALLIVAGPVPRTVDGQELVVSSDTVRVHIEAGSAGFAPDTVRLVAGRPANLVFTRTVASGCVAEVHIPELGVEKTALPQGEPVTITVVPAEAGEFEFLCGMNMRRGTILVSGSP